MANHQRVNVIELSRVAPPPCSVAEASFPLTFFDVLWLQAPPVQRIFFFEISDPNTDTTHLLKSLLPNLKHSLSVALQLFYPLAGSLTLSRQNGEHEIRYIDGDSVTLTVVDSGSYFHELVADQPIDAAVFHPLVPELPTSDLLSLQVTIFPNSGICIGICVHHVVADGRSFMNFMRHWASISRSRGGSLISSLPLYDRTLIPDQNGRKRIFLNQVAANYNVEPLSVRARVDAVRATFVLSRAHIERLRQRVVMGRRHVDGEKPLHCTSFVVTCAYVWVCLAKARGVSGDKTVHFAFAVDCCARMDPAIPVTYFGNCLGACFGDAKASDLARGDGILVACEAIGGAIQGLDGGVLKGAEGWIPKYMSIVASGEPVLSVAGSPMLRVYDTDFGFGRPRKVEVISIEETGAISLAESRDGGGGLEVGLVLPRRQMDGFASLLEEGLKEL